MEMPLNIFLTGGAGYIGSVVTAELLKAGHQVTVYDNLSHGHAAAVPEKATLVAGDLSDREKLNKILSGARFYAVMHFAAFIEAGESMIFPERFFQNNTA